MNHIYILGSGAIGFPLGACLSVAGRAVTAVRTTTAAVAPGGEVKVNLQLAEGRRLEARVPTMSLAQLDRLDGIVVIATKAYANADLAKELERREVRGPIVILQNGLGVEKAFAETLPDVTICRGVLYVTSQRMDDDEREREASFSFRPIQPSRIGLVRGDEQELWTSLQALHTEDFPFAEEPDIRGEVWKKTIVNAVFNSICPLLEVDNGYFSRDAAGLMLAHELVSECVELTQRLGMALTVDEVMRQIVRISKGSTQWISTLQDLKHGRRTEMESLNLAIARVAAALNPVAAVPKVEWLGKMILAKSNLQLKLQSQPQPAI